MKNLSSFEQLYTVPAVAPGNRLRENLHAVKYARYTSPWARCNIPKYCCEIHIRSEDAIVDIKLQWLGGFSVAMVDQFQWLQWLTSSNGLGAALVIYTVVGLKRATNPYRSPVLKRLSIHAVAHHTVYVLRPPVQLRRRRASSCWQAATNTRCV